MAAPLPSYRSSLGDQSAGIAPAFGTAALGSAISRLGGVSDQIEDVAGHQAMMQADIAGQRAGDAYGSATRPADIKLPDGTGAYEQAFRKSAILGAQAQVGIDARASVFDLIDQHRADPQGFQSAVTAAAQGYVSNLPADLRAEALRTYDFWGTRGFAQVHERWQSEQTDQQRADIMQRVDGLAADAGNQARAGDYQGAMALLQHLDAYYQAGGPTTAGGSGALSAVEIERHREAALDSVSANYIHGLIDHASNKTAMLSGLEQGHTGDEVADQALQVLKPETRDRLIAITREGIRADRMEARQAQALNDQTLAVDRASFLGGTVQDDLRMRMDGQAVDNPLVKGDFLKMWPAKDQGAAERAYLSYSRQAAGANAVGELKSEPASAIRQAIAGSQPQGGQGYAEQSVFHDTLAKAADGVLQKREADGASYAAGSSPGVAQAWAAVSQNPDDPAAFTKAVQAGVEEQRRLEVANVQPLPKPYASGLVDQFKTAQTADQRLAVVARVGQLGDDLGRQALDQLEAAGLPKGVDRAVQAAADGDAGRAREIVGRLAIDPKQIPDLSDVKAREVSQAVDGLFSGQTPAAAEAAAANATLHPRNIETYQGGRQLTLQIAKQFAAMPGGDAYDAAAKAAKVVYGDGKVAGYEGLGVVKAPPGVDTDALTRGLENLRQNVDLSHLAPTEELVRQFMPKDAPDVQVRAEMYRAQRDHAAWEGDIRRYGTWVNAAGGFGLVGPAGGFVPGADGRARVWSAQDAISAAGGKPPAAVLPPTVDNPFVEKEPPQSSFLDLLAHPSGVDNGDLGGSR